MQHRQREDTGQMCFLMVPWGCAPVCICLSEESHCCLTCWIALVFRMVLRKHHYLDVLLCLPRSKNNFGALWEVCLGFFSGFRQIVETGALIFKVFGKNPRFLTNWYQVKGFCILVNFFLSLLPRDVTVNICTFINNFCIH